jgi:type I restriction enzyme M protein
LFYNTGIYTYVWIVTNRKRPERAGKVQLINGTEFAWKMKKSLGDKRKRIGDGSDGAPDHIAALTRLYGDFQDGVRQTLGEIRSNIDPKRDQGKSLFISRIFDNQDFGYLKITVDRPLRLNFVVSDERIARFCSNPVFVNLAISRKRKDKGKIVEETLAGKQAQKAILDVLDGMRNDDAEPVRNRAVFTKQLAAAFDKAGIELDAKLKAALLAPGSLGEKDPNADICFDRNGDAEPDADLRDTENVPFPPGIALPLPLDYEGKKNKGKLDPGPLLKLVREHCEAYLKAEVLPYRADAWIDHAKIKVGYEIPFNRHFYEYEPPRPLQAIEADILALEQQIMAMLKEVTA